MSNCLHCKAPVVKKKFCCVGCKSAYYLISKLKLNEYYRYCSDIYGKSPSKVLNYKSEINYLDDVIETGDKKHKIYLLINGIVCGSCVWLIENSLRSLEYVISARVMISTNRLEVSWDGNKDLINKIIDLVKELGYQVAPFNLQLLNSKENQEEKKLLKRIAVSGFATAQIMTLALAVWIGNFNHSMQEYLRYVFHIISGMIAIPTILFSSSTFIKSALNAIRKGRTNIDVPISIGIITTLLISIQETIRMSYYVYYDAAASLTFLLLTGRYLEVKVRNKAKSGIRSLMFQQPNVAYVLKNGEIICISASSVKENDIVLVKPGERFAVDGRVIEGKSEVDNSLISGETIPVGIEEDSYVYAGTINLNNTIKIKAEKTGSSTTLSEILRLVENIEKNKSKFVIIADRLAEYFTPAIISLAFITFCIWYNNGIFEATLNGVALLIITCPCAIGLAVPMVQIVVFSRLIKKGIFIRNPDVLERLNKVDTLIFDKTGTLTIGKAILLNFDLFEEQEKCFIASIAAKSNHILCKSVSDKFDGKILDLNVTETRGEGLYAKNDKDEFWLGSKKWCNVEYSCNNKDNYLEMWYKKNNEEAKRLIFHDELRKEAKQVLDELKKKYNVILLSGDRSHNVLSIANKLGIKHYFGEKNFKEKYKFVMNLVLKGKKPLMIGDGLNDVLALKAAYASISPKTSIAISQNIADVLYNGDLKSILTIFYAARNSIKVIQQNFVISIIYNCIAIPIAVMGLVNPIVAAVSMSLSSITVILNSLKLSLQKNTKKHK